VPSARIRPVNFTPLGDIPSHLFVPGTLVLALNAESISNMVLSRDQDAGTMVDLPPGEASHAFSMTRSTMPRRSSDRPMRPAKSPSSPWRCWLYARRSPRIASRRRHFAGCPVQGRVATGDDPSVFQRRRAKNEEPPRFPDGGSCIPASAHRHAPRPHAAYLVAGVQQPEELVALVAVVLPRMCELPELRRGVQHRRSAGGRFE
jgi:hypothetical protein